jgi:hypothetical protein
MALRSRQSGKRWLIELIKKLLGVAWDLWEHRNGNMHSTEVAELNENLRQEVQILWHHQVRLQLARKNGFPTSFAQLLQWPLVKQEHWQNLMRSKIERSEAETRHPTYAAEREGMRRFLTGAEKRR